MFLLFIKNKNNVSLIFFSFFFAYKCIYLIYGNENLSCDGISHKMKGFFLSPLFCNKYINCGLPKIAISIYCGYSKEPSHGDGSFKCPQHVFIVWRHMWKVQFVTLLCIGTFYSCNGMYVPNFSSYEILKWTAH